VFIRAYFIYVEGSLPSRVFHRSVPSCLEVSLNKVGHGFIIKELILTMLFHSHHAQVVSLSCILRLNHYVLHCWVHSTRLLTHLVHKLNALHTTLVYYRDVPDVVINSVENLGHLIDFWKCESLSKRLLIPRIFISIGK
jgi:hypothetical protein